MLKIGKGKATQYALRRYIAGDSAAEHAFPLYRIEKRPKLRGKQGMYSVVGMDGYILRRGHDLPQVLRVLEQKLIRPID